MRPTIYIEDIRIRPTTIIKLRHRLAVFVMLTAGVWCIQLAHQGELVGGMIVAAIGFVLALALDTDRAWSENE